jgi:hypothetical protein
MFAVSRWLAEVSTHPSVSVRWLPYLVGAALHAALGAVGYVSLVGLAMGAADSGILEAPLWLKAFAWTVVALMLPVAWWIAEFAPVDWLAISGLISLLLVCLCNSLMIGRAGSAGPYLGKESRCGSGLAQRK